MKVIFKTILLLFRVIILFMIVLFIPSAFLMWLSGYRVPVGSLGMWFLFLVCFIWLFWPLRILVAMKRVSLRYYFKQWFFDTKIAIWFIGNLIICNLILLSKIIKGLIKHIYKH